MTTPTPTAPGTHATELHSGITTTWLFMPASWPNPVDCSTCYYGPNLTRADFDVFDPVLIPPGSSPCLPNVVFTWWRQDILRPDVTYNPTSISLWADNFRCPDAYTTASTYAVDATSIQIFCCPSDFQFVSSYRQGNIGQCLSLVPSGASVTVFTSSSAWVAQSGLVLQSNSVAGIQVNGWSFSTSLISVSSTASSTTNGRNSGSGTSTLSPSSSDNNLSTGAMVGIGVGVAGVVLAVIGLVVGFILYKRIGNQHNQSPQDRHSGLKDQYPHVMPLMSPPFQNSFPSQSHPSSTQVGPYELSDSRR